ncbi:MAG TPA: D-alanyl-D-alanine carboxypeptidase family protein [Aurantimonas sp.]
MRRTGFLTTQILFAACILVVNVTSYPAVAQEPAAESRIETAAKQALLVDGETGTVLFQKAPDAPFPPASLAKMMTMEIVFAALRAGELRLDTEFSISEHAWRTGGAPSGSSTMFAKLNSRVPVEALIRGTIVQSANDAAIAIAEGMEGSEEAFAQRMNERARELGMTASRFVNPTGLPADGQEVTVRDLLTLARHIRATYPELYKIYAEPAFEWNGIFQRNRNPLLAMELGADGMGTGYTEASGYALVGVTQKRGRVTLLAMSGLETSKERAEEARRLLTWAEEAFEPRTLFESGASIGAANVFGGSSGSVPLAVSQPVKLLVPVDGQDRVSAQIRYTGPLIAPIEEGDRVASLEIRVDEDIVLTQALYAGTSVFAGDFADRAMGAVKELAVGWLRAF